MRNIEDIAEYIICDFIKQTSVEKFKELKEIVENER